MQLIEGALPPELRPHVGFVLVTFDPHGIHLMSSARTAPGCIFDPLSWLLLSGHPDDVLELATLLGITYTRDQSGGVIHANVLTVLDKAGEIVHRHEGLHQDMTSTLEAIRRAVQD